MGKLNALTYRMVDTMKWNKDQMVSQLSDAEIEGVISCLADMNLTHIAVAMPMDETADYVAAGVTPPSPRTAADHAAKWFDTIHAAGKKVFYRGTFCGIEGIYDFAPRVGGNRFPSGASYENLTPEVFTDTFTRTENAPIATYRTDHQGGNDWTTNGTQLAAPAANGWVRTCLTADSYTDFVVTAKIKKVGNQQLVVRATTNASLPGYGFQLRDTQTLRIERPGIENLGEVTLPDAYVDDAWYNIKVQCLGTTIRGKVWPVGSSEPGPWSISIVDGTFASGYVGFSGETSWGLFDDLEITPDAIDPTQTWLGRISKWITDHPDMWEDGDIFAPLPERTEGIFQDATSFLAYDGDGIQSHYATFFNELLTTAQAAFVTIDKAVICGFTSNNYSEVNSGWIPNSIFTTAGITAVDHYGITHEPTEMSSDLSGIYSSKGEPIFLQEWGDYWNQAWSEADRLVYLTAFYEMLAGLVTSGKLIGFNYWGGWDGDLEGLLLDNGNDTFTLNARGLLLKDYFAADVVVPPPAPPPTDEPIPTPTTENYTWYGGQKLPVSE